MDKIKFSVKKTDKGEVVSCSFSPVNCSSEENEFVCCLGGILLRKRFRVLTKKETFEKLRASLPEGERLLESEGLDKSGTIYGKGRFIIEMDKHDVIHFFKFISNFNRLCRSRKIIPHTEESWGHTFIGTLK